MRSISIRRRSASLLAALALATGMLGTTASAAHASTTSVPAASAVTAPSTAAGSWQFRGIFPDPVTCNIAGIASGRQYVCNWSVFWWNLYTWED